MRAKSRPKMVAHVGAVETGAEKRGCLSKELDLAVRRFVLDLHDGSMTCCGLGVGTAY